MKLLHTGDWHLGHSLYGYDREVEQQEMLRQIAALVEAEQPRLMVVSGDIFDSAQPPVWSQRLWVDALMALRRAAPDMSIVAISGNHDSASRHEIFRQPWHHLGVNVIGQLSCNSDTADLIVEVPGVAFVAVVPYTSPRNIPAHIGPRLMAAIAGRNTAGLPVIVVAHTTVTGSLFAGQDYHRKTDNVEIIGGIESVGLDFFGRGYDYLALGHIHRPQVIAGSCGRAHYAGTPMAMGFDETHPHGVILAEVEHGSEPKVEYCPLTPLLPLVDLPAPGEFAPWPQVKEQFENFPADTQAYIRLNVINDSQLSPFASAEAADIAAAKEARFCTLNTKRNQGHGTANDPAGIRIEEFRQLTPMEVVDRYVSEHNLVFDDSLRVLFRSVLDELGVRN